MKSQVTIPTWLAAIAVGAIVALQTWMVKEISELKVDVAGISTQISMHISAHHTQITKAP